jgi:uroporphyrinogen-III synthase
MSARSGQRWVDVCDVGALHLDRGVCALVGSEQVALFRVSPDGELFAVSNYDPFSNAFVLSRGIVGSKGDVIKVASPLYKNGFCLRTGKSLDDPDIRVPTYPVRVVAGRVQVGARGFEGKPAEARGSGARRPLGGRTIAIAESREASLLSRMLGEKGASVVSYPLVKITDPPDVAQVEAFVRDLAAGRFDALVLVTGEGVRRLVGVADRLGIEMEMIAALRNAWTVSRGPKPARALRDIGVLPSVPTEYPTTHGIIEALQTRDWNGTRVGVQLCGDKPNDRVVEFLTAAGAHTSTVSPYAYAPLADEQKIVQLFRQMLAGTIDVAAFTNSVQVERLFLAAAARGVEETLRRGLRRTKVAALGPVVASALRNRGCDVDIVPDRSFNLRTLLQEIVHSFNDRPYENTHRYS